MSKKDDAVLKSSVVRMLARVLIKQRTRLRERGVLVNHVCLLFSLKLMVWQADVVEPMRLCTTLIRLLRQKTEAVPSCVRLVIGLSIDTLLVSENDELDDLGARYREVEGDHQRLWQAPFVVVSIHVGGDDGVSVVFDDLDNIHRHPDTN